MANPSWPDALDALEERALGALASSSTGVREAVAAACNEPNAPLYKENPPVDPSEARRSVAELLALLDVLEGKPAAAPDGRTRAGYALATHSARTREPGVAPAFVAALGADDLRKAFPDLWAVDAALWETLDSGNVRDLARLWLESPGRRLVQDIGVIERMPNGERFGATDFSPERIDKAVGLHYVGATDVHESLRAHHELHAAVPGQTYEVWEPRPVDAHQQVVRALRLLEEGSPLGLRGAALAWLLDRAADEPFYEVDEVRRDLREDLSMRLGTALRSWLDPTPMNEVSRQLETLTLQHAARFVEHDRSERATRRGWAIARWLQGCLRRSPYFGGDEEVLVAHLRARLPVGSAPVPPDADVLHPVRFSVDDDGHTDGLDVAEVAFVAGVIVHYTRVGERTLLPTPVPLVHALQRIAGRDVRPLEEEADRAFDTHNNALGWSAYSIIAPVAARRLLTELRIGWLAHVNEKPQVDALDRFRLNPKRHEWFAFAVHREGQHLKPRALEVAVDAFRKLVHGEEADAHVIATFGAGILNGFGDEDATNVLTIAVRSEIAWRPFVLDALAGTAFRLNKTQLFQAVMEQLFELMSDGTQADKTRLNAAFFAVQRVLPPKVPERDVLQKRIADVAGDRSFPEHAELRRAIRRFGVAIPAGSKR